MARSLIASDNFNRAALGADWQNLVSASRGDVITASSTHITGQYAGLGDDHPTARWVGAGTFLDNQYASVVLLNVVPGGTTYRTGVIVRSSADTGAGRDYYEAFVNLNGTIKTNLVKFVNGTMTVLAESTSPSWAVNDRLDLEVEGTTLRVCKNGTPLGGIFTVTDTSLTTGQPGVSCTSAMTADNWEAGTLTSDVTPPVITGPSGSAGAASISLSLAENISSIGTWSANEVVTWSVVASGDYTLVTINPSTGALSFNSPPNYEAPADSGSNNVYNVTVRATDSSSNISSQDVIITITDVVEGASGTVTISDWVNNTGTLYPSGTQVDISFHDITSRALVLRSPTATLNVSNDLVITNASLGVGTTYCWFAENPLDLTVSASGRVTAT